MLKIKRALVSVSDKTGLVDFAGGLVSMGVEIISTGGTARVLKDSGIEVTEISAYTGFPEMLDGRVKTLHPKIHAGLLSLRDNADHMRQIREHGIGLMDMVVVNLYPFERTVAASGVRLEEAIENIDIGGPSMLRSAAKNYASVAVVSDPKFYPDILTQMRHHKGSVLPQTLKMLAAAAFARTASYDRAIARYLSDAFGLGSAGPLPDELHWDLKKKTDLRYGENPHQKAALYAWSGQGCFSLAEARQLHGKELSFNNYLDLNAAFELLRDFDRPAACIVKHTNPTGVACSSTLKQAYRQAWQTDPLSAFGGIIGLNRVVDSPTAEAIVKSGFMECVIAPSYAPEALSVLTAKKNVRILELPFDDKKPTKMLDAKMIRGAWLLQEEDRVDVPESSWRIVSRKKPTKAQMTGLRFVWRVARHVKSNAIVLGRGTQTVGIGMGQTSRVDSVFMAIKRAGQRARGSVMASDAFFPKADNILLARKAGITAIIQPGGSVADEEIVRAADKARIAMIVTGQRHFKH